MLVLWLWNLVLLLADQWTVEFEMIRLLRSRLCLIVDVIVRRVDAKLLIDRLINTDPFSLGIAVAFVDSDYVEFTAVDKRSSIY